MAALHHHDLRPFVHSHAFGDAAAPVRERALWWVTGVTLAAMVMELAVGYWSGSLALVADGWHMGTHAMALGGAALAAALARRAHGNARFAFGGWKIEVLAAYSSGLLLLAVSVWIAIDAVMALSTPRVVAYPQAIGVAVLGLVVNAVCAWVLSRGDAGARAAAGGHADAAQHDHAASPASPPHEPASAAGHGHDHGHRHDHHGHPGGHDHNFRAAYLHVLADALTSVFAIAALCAGRFLDWSWMDPFCGLLGALVILRWSWGLLCDTGAVLLDFEPDSELPARIRERIERGNGDEIADLHVWRVGPGRFAAIISIVSHEPQAPAHYKERLQDVESLAHVTVEVQACLGEAC